MTNLSKAQARTLGKAEVVNWGGYYAVVSAIIGTDRQWVHAKRYRSFDTAKKSADRINAKTEG